MRISRIPGSLSNIAVRRSRRGNVGQAPKVAERNSRLVPIDGAAFCSREEGSTVVNSVSSGGLFVWFLWLIWFVSLIWTESTKQTRWTK